MNIRALPLDSGGGTSQAALAPAVDIPFTVRQAALFLKSQPGNHEPQSIGGRMA
jgi:hypothetical protein